MAKQILLIGLSHKTAPLEIRERLAVEPDTLQSALAPGGLVPDICQSVILSTCNRLEIYTVVDDLQSASSAIINALSCISHISKETLLQHLFIYHNEAVVHHLMQVASGLDSMVLGEPQILGQVTTAYETALAHKTTGAILSTLFRSAISTGKRVRTETAIGANSASISSVAANLANNLLGDLSQQRVLLIGAGEMGAIAVRALLKRGVSQITVANRTYDKAFNLAQIWSGEAIPFAALSQAIAQADIIISSTSAPHPILTHQLLAPVMATRSDQPLLIIDIAVPRDVAVDVACIKNIYLRDIDDLQGQADENLREREAAIPQVNQIIATSISEFTAWLASLAATSTITALRQQAEQLRQLELQRLFNRLDLDERERNLVNTMSHRLINKLLHEPTLCLKHETRQGNGDTYITTTRRLFALDSP